MTGAIRIQVRRTTGTEPPPDLQFGELAFADDGSRLFIGQVDGTVHEFVTAQPDPVLGTTLAGEGLYVGRDGDVLQFKGLVAGDNIALIPEANRLTIAASNSSLLNGFQAYTVAGTYYWTVPDGVYFALTKTIGAGAGGAAFNNLIGGGGGGGGGKAEKLVAGLVPGEIIIITVGAGGIAGVSSGDGQAGGTSSFGPFVSATGGKGGSRFGHGGQAGVGIGGDFNTSLGPGVLGSLWADDPNRPVGGAGGGPSDRIIFSQNAPPGLGPGAGGGGGGSDNGSVKTPSPGRDGAVIIRW